MSKSVFTKKVVVAAAIVAAFGVTAVAAMKANIIESHTDLRSAVSDIEEIQQMSDDEKLDVKYPDEFTNGYKFDKGYESNDTAVDDEGNVIDRKTKRTRTKSDNASLYLKVQVVTPIADEGERAIEADNIYTKKTRGLSSKQTDIQAEISEYERL